MCVIAYKPINVKFPSEDILKNCFDNNPDGAGFMYALNEEVHIQKGFVTFEAFYKALNEARKISGDDVPYVMHFRIATQGYEKTMTHPFPLSSKMKKLKKTNTTSNIGVAHNGIIELTSDGSKDYSDTMKFITDYLTLIIRGYEWYEDERTKTLIERLINGSRLAILDKFGHCELLGKTWTEDNGIFYSNTSYSYQKPKYSYVGWGNDWFKSWGKSSFNTLEDWDKYYDIKTDSYKFNGTNCPAMMEDDYYYCDMCANAKKCAFMESEFEELTGTY